MSPTVMGIVNVTPDSFSDGGRLASVAQTQGWRVTDNAADDVPHLIVVAPGVDVAAIRAGTTPRAAAPVILLAADVGNTNVVFALFATAGEGEREVSGLTMPSIATAARGCHCACTLGWRSG